MNDKTIINIGKSFFWISFLLGSVCLFGYLMTKDIVFAFYGFFLLIIGSVLNTVAIVALLFYGFFYRNQLNICLKSTRFILINIPVAIIYTAIGIVIINP